MIQFWVDGGLLTGRGVYWSARVEGRTEMPLRKQDVTGRYKTNNDAEWLALREGLQYAVTHFPSQTEDIVIYSDSRLVVMQYAGAWRTKVARHARLRNECRALVERLACEVRVVWVPRAVSVAQLGH